MTLRIKGYKDKNYVRQFKCKFCGKVFIPNYRISKKKTLHFCSKSCKAKFQETTVANKIWSRKSLENKIKSLIKQELRYLTRKEIEMMLRISSGTISKYKVSIIKINKELGYTKPKSLFEQKVAKQLKTIFPKLNIIREKIFKDCLSPKGYPLRFDFYIKDLNILVEADGFQHYNKNNPYYSYYYKQCDCIKDNYALEKGIKLIRIKYKPIVNKKYIKSHFE